MSLVRALVLGLACLALGGCGTLGGLGGPGGPAGAASAIEPETSRSLYLDVVRALQEQGRWNASLAYLDAYDNLYPGDEAALILRADAFAEIGDVAAAEQIYAALIDGAVGPSAHSGLGHIAAARGDWGEAARRFQIAVDAQPARATFLNNLGYARLQLGQPAEALRILARAHELDMESVGIRNNYALALMAMGRDEALNDLLISISSPPERSALLEFLSTGQMDL